MSNRAGRRRAPLALDDRCRADLWLAIGRSLEAGLDLPRALAGATDLCGGRLREPLEDALGRIRSGRPAAAAFAGTGISAPLDAKLLEGGEATGRLGPVLLGLAARYEGRDRRWRRMRARLALPAFVLMLAVLISPLPALVAGRIDGLEFVMRGLGMLALLGGSAWLVRIAVRRWTARGWPRGLVALGERTPVMGALIRAQREHDAAEAIALGLGAGLPADRALAGAASGMSAGLRPALVAASRATGRGESLLGALERTGIFGNEALAVLRAGEEAGRVDEALERFAKLTGERLDDAYDTAARLVPPLAYLLVIGIVASGMVL